MSTPTAPMAPQDVQALHRRIAEAKANGQPISDADREAADALNSNPFAQFDRPWASDDL